MRLNDAVTGLFLVFFAVAEMLFTRSFPSLHGQAYGPALFPVIIGTGLTGCGLVLIARGLLARRSAAKAVHNADNNNSAVWLDLGLWGTDSRVRNNGLILLACLLAYILFSDAVGFILTSLLILLVLLHRLGVAFWKSVIVAIATTLVLQLLFAKMLLVPLPAGLLQGIVW